LTVYFLIHQNRFLISFYTEKHFYALYQTDNYLFFHSEQINIVVLLLANVKPIS